MVPFTTPIQRKQRECNTPAEWLFESHVWVPEASLLLVWHWKIAAKILKLYICGLHTHSRMLRRSSNSSGIASLWAASSHSNYNKEKQWDSGCIFRVMGNSLCTVGYFIWLIYIIIIFKNTFNIYNFIFLFKNFKW